MTKYLIEDDFGLLDWWGQLDHLPAWRRARVLRLRHESDRRQSVAAWLLLRRSCRELLGLSEVPAVAHSASGKPFFPTLPDVYFNLSHCPVAVACAMASEPVGIDIEAVTTLDIDVARHVLADNELQQVMDDPHPAVAFTRLWTMKESLLKRTGKGISSDLKSLLIDAGQFHTVTDANGRWVCSVTPWA